MTKTTAPAYTFWAYDAAQTDADAELFYFRFGWVNIWAIDADSAKAIALDIMETAWANR